MVKRLNRRPAKQKEWEPWLLLSTIPGIGQMRLMKLVLKFGSPERVFEASESELISINGMDRRVVKGVRRGGDKERVKEELERMERLQISLVPFFDEGYPENLKPYENSPPFLYARGGLLPSDQKAVAIVGSRRATFYGKGVAEELGYELARRGITVVSGMARGIDTAAHQGALKAKGRTIAVLGCGVDMVYPPENRELRDRILQAGAVVSEFHLGTQPLAGNFPQRNRVISGLSLGVVCVEASGNSGVFSTVQWAADQGKEVFAVPGDVKKKTSVGTNRLIREGAKLVMGVEDILEELNLDLETLETAVKNIADLSSEGERKVYELLTQSPLHIDKIAHEVALPTSQTLSILLSLELKELIRQLPGKTFVRKKAMGS